MALAQQVINTCYLSNNLLWNDMGLLKAMEAMDCYVNKQKKVVPDGEILLSLSRNDYNHIAEGLIVLAKNKAATLKKLQKDDFRRKSYGCDLYAINTLLDNLRKQLNRQI